jgi:hypothetical protein
MPRIYRLKKGADIMKDSRGPGVQGSSAMLKNYGSVCELENNERPTSNIQHRILNEKMRKQIRDSGLNIFCDSSLDVRCSMFDVHLLNLYYTARSKISRSLLRGSSTLDSLGLFSQLGEVTY